VFRVQTDSGEEFDLAQHENEKIVLYFYPRADAPGCTIESCEFRNTVKKFTKKGVTVIGVSPDTTNAQSKFKEKFDLNFTLLADAEKEIANKYGVMKEKNMYGKKVMGVARTEPLSPAARRQRAVLSMSSDLFFRPECAGVGGPYPEYAPKHFQLKLFF
jgi:thioredoxin-dependent peroxiredoxin